MTMSALLLLSLAVPAAGAVVILLLRYKPNAREAASLVTAGALFTIVLRIYVAVSGGDRPALVLAEPIPGIPIALEAEPLGVLFALVASFLWIVTTMYSIGYMRGHTVKVEIAGATLGIDRSRERRHARFYLFFAVAIAAVMGVAFAGNLFTLFVFYEVLTLTTFPLVTHTRSEAARKAGRVYLGILFTTSIVFQLLAIVWTYAIAGTLDFQDGGILSGRAAGAVVPVLLGLFVFGIGKAAVMPFHRWLPAAMVAPTPVSALLHAVAVVKAGVFAVLKVTVYIFGIDFIAATGASVWLMWVAAATIILASLVAFTRDNLKVRLAYSTVSQLSYVVLGAMLANHLGVVGSGMHIAMHAFGKITLFFCAGVIIISTNRTEVSQLKGVGRVMPITFGAFFIGALSIVGLPPTGGAWSKWFLGLGALEAGQIGLVAVLMLSSLLSLAYLMEIPLQGFFGRPKRIPDRIAPGEEHDYLGGDYHAPPKWSMAAIVTTAVACVILFLYPEPFYRLMTMVAGP